jgi:hypothetical protein
MRLSNAVWLRLALAVAVISCASPLSAREPEKCSARNGTTEAKIGCALSRLGEIADDLEEFGTISASSAALIRDPKKRFEFELGLTPRELFERNRLEGASALRDLMAYSARGAVRVVPGADLPIPAPPAAGYGTEPGAPADPAAAEPAEPADAQAEDPATPEAPALVPVPTIPAGAPASGTLPTAAFTPGLAVAPDALTMSVRDLIKLSSDDYLTSKLLGWTSAPEFQASNKLLFAAVLTVSIRPGWRTYTGYAGEIDLRAGYWCISPPRKAKGCALTQEDRRREECIPESYHEEVSPLAFAAFPALDAQVLDERSSFRRQLALALAIEAQGPQAAGALEQELVRRLEHDLATRSTVNTLVGYNESGVHFGWRFSPKAFAQVDATDPDAGPGLVLQPQSFPALVFLIADKWDLPRQYGGSCPDTYEEKDGLAKKIEDKQKELEPLRSKDPKDDADEKKLQAAEHELRQLELARDNCPDLIHDKILIDYTTRWFRAPDPGADQSWIPFRGWWKRLWQQELREPSYFGWAERVTDAEAVLRSVQDERTKAPSTGEYPHLEYQLEKKLAQIRAASVKVDVVQQIPIGPPDPPTIASVTPRAIVSAPNGYAWFVVVGKGFLGGAAKNAKGEEVPPRCPAEGSRPVVVVSGAKAEVQAGCTDEVLVARVASARVQAVAGKADVAVVTTSGKTLSAKDALTAVVSPGRPKGSVDIGWVVAADGSAYVSSISTRGEQNLLDIVKALSDPPRRRGRRSVHVDPELKAKEQPAP